MSKLNITRSKILTVVYKHFRVPNKLLRAAANKGIEWMAGEILFNIPLGQFSDHLPNSVMVFETGIRESALTVEPKKFKKTTVLAEYRTCHASTNDEYSATPYCFISPGSGPVYAMLPMESFTGNGLFIPEENIAITSLNEWLQYAYPNDAPEED